MFTDTYDLDSGNNIPLDFDQASLNEIAWVKLKYTLASLEDRSEQHWKRTDFKMNSRGEGILAVQEERARIGGVEVARKTVIAATDEGLVSDICSMFIHHALQTSRSRL